MNKIVREITKEQYIEVTEHHNARGIFKDSEVMGYGIYNTNYYERDGKFYVSFYLGDSCD